jgi:hypothetical protein
VEEPELAGERRDLLGDCRLNRCWVVLQLLNDSVRDLLTVLRTLWLNERSAPRVSKQLRAFQLRILGEAPPSVRSRPDMRQRGVRLVLNVVEALGKRCRRDVELGDIEQRRLRGGLSLVLVAALELVRPLLIVTVKDGERAIGYVPS